MYDGGPYQSHRWSEEDSKRRTFNVAECDWGIRPGCSVERFFKRKGAAVDQSKSFQYHRFNLWIAISVVG